MPIHRSLLVLILAACGAAPPSPKQAPLDPVSALEPNTDRESLSKFDWPHETAVSPAEKVFVNVMVQQGMTAERFMIGMLAMRTSLGVECKHCHDLEQYRTDELEPKRTARQMLLMSYHLNRESFAGEARVTCFTCHRGHAKPETQPESPAPAAPLPAILTLTEEQSKLPAGKVFKNLQVFTARRAMAIPVAMQALTVSLGVECVHCHVEGAWDKDDKPAKKRTREMIKMTARANAEIYGTSKGIRCWTCHRGSLAVLPPRTP
jgi:hypothetical protein